MEDRCGRCGIPNDGGTLNQHPWLVAIREKVHSTSGGWTYHFHTGTLVSDEYVVTAASIFRHTPIDEKNFTVLLGATDYHVAISHQQGHIPLYIKKPENLIRKAFKKFDQLSMCPTSLNPPLKAT